MREKGDRERGWVGEGERERHRGWRGKRTVVNKERREEERKECLGTKIYLFHALENFLKSYTALAAF